MRCVVRTPEGELFDGDVRMAVLPATDGEIGILSGHAAMVVALGVGACRLETEEGIRTYALEGGFSQVHQSVVTVLTTRAEDGATIDRAKAEKALADLRTVEAKGPGARQEKLEKILWARARLSAAK